MRSEYDFSKSHKNPYARQLKRQITIRLDTSVVSYFSEADNSPVKQLQSFQKCYDAKQLRYFFQP